VVDRTQEAMSDLTQGEHCSHVRSRRCGARCAEKKRPDAGHVGSLLTRHVWLEKSSLVPFYTRPDSKGCQVWSVLKHVQSQLNYASDQIVTVGDEQASSKGCHVDGIGQPDSSVRPVNESGCAYVSPTALSFEGSINRLGAPWAHSLAHFQQ
jgi:hypothetical protein